MDNFESSPCGSSHKCTEGRAVGPGVLNLLGLSTTLPKSTCNNMRDFLVHFRYNKVS